MSAFFFCYSPALERYGYSSRLTFSEHLVELQLIFTLTVLSRTRTRSLLLSKSSRFVSLPFHLSVSPSSPFCRLFVYLCFSFGTCFLVLVFHRVMRSDDTKETFSSFNLSSKRFKERVRAKQQGLALCFLLGSAVPIEPDSVIAAAALQSVFFPPSRFSQ